MDPSSHPDRSFTVTGTSVSARTAETMEEMSFGLRRRAAPHPVFSTLGTEHPQFRSMRAGRKAAHPADRGGRGLRLRCEDLEARQRLVRGPDKEPQRGAVVARTGRPPTPFP